MGKLVKLGVLPVFAIAVFLSASASAQVAFQEKKVHLDRKKHFEAGMQEYGISGGFGVSPEDKIITDFILLPKWGYIVADFDGPIPGAFEIDLEGVAGMFMTPGAAYETGFNLLFTYNFETGTQFVPFFSAGAGFLYTNLGSQVPDVGSKFNASPQGGLGVKYFINDTTSLSVMGRIRHISNMSTVEPNGGIDGGMLLFGINFLH